jgi:hypothetical protein
VIVFDLAPQPVAVDLQQQLLRHHAPGVVRHIGEDARASAGPHARASSPDAARSRR